ncbi:MAG: carbohydrate kinase family protein [Spirochaetales bacterium]|nr:carbohydrate kinase family protein [Spirochaetales bacterium]
MRVLVSGLVNIETTLRVDGFPIEYRPVLYPFGGVSSSVSGVGVNVAAALKRLGDEVAFLSLVGADAAGDLALEGLSRLGVPTDGVLRDLDATAQSVILYDGDGRRQINVDLKDIQERRYPAGRFRAAAAGADAFVLCNINFNRELLPLARESGKPVFTDVHTLSDPADDYNEDFMAAAEVLFVSDERLWAPPAEAARELMDRYGCRIVVVGLGAKGALLLETGSPALAVSAVRARKVISTIGAGDALFSAFAHFLLAGRRAPEALELATRFASWKIGETGAAAGFLTEKETLELKVGQL